MLGEKKEGSEGKGKQKEGGQQGKSAASFEEPASRNDFFKQCAPLKLSGDTFKLVHPPAAKEALNKRLARHDKKQLRQIMKKDGDQLASEESKAAREKKIATQKWRDSQVEYKRLVRGNSKLQRKASDLQYQAKAAEQGRAFQSFQGNFTHCPQSHVVFLHCG